MNKLNKLLKIVIHWSKHRIGFDSDMKKMYNTIQLRQEDWCLQRNIWQRDLDKSKIPKEKIIKTLIYGIKSSGNQAERGLRETAKCFAKEYPLINQIGQNDIYVDDCLSPENMEELALEKADQLELVLNRRSFSLKGITFSKRDPPNNLSTDDCSVMVAGMKWFPKKDMVSLDIGKLNFAKKQRGKKPVQGRNTIPFNLTRRQYVSKVAKTFGLTGKITPSTATMKLDLHI